MTKQQPRQLSKRSQPPPLQQQQPAQEHPPQQASCPLLRKAGASHSEMASTGSAQTVISGADRASATGTWSGTGSTLDSNCLQSCESGGVSGVHSIADQLASQLMEERAKHLDAQVRMSKLEQRNVALEVENCKLRAEAHATQAQQIAQNWSVWPVSTPRGATSTPRAATVLSPSRAATSTPLATTVALGASPPLSSPLTAYRAMVPAVQVTSRILVAPRMPMPSDGVDSTFAGVVSAMPVNPRLTTPRRGCSGETFAAGYTPVAVVVQPTFGPHQSRVVTQHLGNSLSAPPYRGANTSFVA